MVQVVPFPSSALIPLRKAHFGDCADAAEKASVLRFPYFLHSPLEVSHTTVMAGTFLRDPPMDLSLLKIFSSAVWRHDGPRTEPGNPFDSRESGEPEVNDGNCSFSF